MLTRYLDRIGVAPDRVRHTDRETLERLQRTHVTTVPFETLAITGDPFGERDGAGVSLDPTVLYEKIVERERGGFCYELNGLFGWLLAELGFDVEVRAAMVVGDDGAGPPANHRTHVVSLDRRYVVDVGLGIPTMRQPLPLDGSVREDEASVAWRVVESDRPDVDYATQYRESEGEWTIRYVFRDVPRERCFFESTCEYLATAPESSFTGDPVVTIATERGHTKLTPGSLTRIRGGEERRQSLDADEWYAALEREFGIDYCPLIEC